MKLRDHLFSKLLSSLYASLPNDPDLKVWKGVIDNDIELLKEGLEAGGNPNITDVDILKNYARQAIDNGCFEEWRAFYLYLHEANNH